MSNYLRKFPGITMAHSNSLLTATGAETVHDTTVRLDFSIGGKMYSKSGTNVDAATPTTDYNTGAAFTGLVGTTTTGQGCIFVWAYNSSGTVKAMQGPIEDVDAAGNFVMYPEFPPVPDDVCPFAYSVSKYYGTAGTFTFGTSNWNASGHTHTIVNVACLPDRPAIS